MKAAPPHRRHLSPRRVLACCLAALTAAQLPAAAMKSIVVSANAASTYVRPTDDQGKIKPESYIFAPGKYFDGRAADGSLAKIAFADIARTLAPSLARQNYFPTKDVRSANIIIVVHWGVTEVFEDSFKDARFADLNKALDDYGDALKANGTADPTAVNSALSQHDNAVESAQSAIARNAALLGYKPTLDEEQRKPFGSAAPEMNAELNEERYFVILMAYDLQRMQTEHKAHLIWSTRISIRSPGHNFTEAMPALVAAGAEVYGRKVDGLVRVEVRDKPGKVELGETKFLGAVEKPKAEERKK